MGAAVIGPANPLLAQVEAWEAEWLQAGDDKHWGDAIAWGHAKEIATRLFEADPAVDELAKAKAVIAEANNSLYGSQSYFLSANGGEWDKYHLARPIEALKERARKAAPSPMRHRCETCGTVDGHELGCPENEPPECKPDNPPAFPVQSLVAALTDELQGWVTDPATVARDLARGIAERGLIGMTLWDHFAGQALAGWPVSIKMTAAELAVTCAVIADAMLAERARRGIGK